MELTSSTIRQHIIQMASLVEMALAQALNENTSLIDDIHPLENQIDGYKNHIDDMIFKYIALKAPNSRDLRLTLSIQRINPVLERIGDQSILIKRYYDDIGYSYPKLENMGQIVKELLQKTIDSFVHGNISLAEEVMNEDEEVNTFNRELIEEFLMAMKNNQIDHRRGSKALWIAKNLERIGDLATCIAKETLFIEQGELHDVMKTQQGQVQSEFNPFNYLNSLNGVKP